MRMLESEFFPMRLMLVADEEEFEKLIEKLPKADLSYGKYFPPRGSGVTIAFDTPRGLIVLVAIGDLEELEDDEALSILTHEAVHVWQFTAKAMRVKNPDNETEAYAIQYYARYLVKEFRYHQGKRNAPDKGRRAR